MTSLVDKLQIKEVQHFGVLNTPEKLRDFIQEQRITTSLPETEIKGLLVFCRSAEDLTSFSDTHLTKLSKEALLWIAFPKRTSEIATDLGRDYHWNPLVNRQWIAVRQVSINASWSALRFRQKELVPEIKRGTDYPGIDRKTKTVELPGELREILQKSDLLQAFQSQSFTFRKEAVVSILEAKKEITKRGRIEKIVASLNR